MFVILRPASLPAKMIADAFFLVHSYLSSDSCVHVRNGKDRRCVLTSLIDVGDIPNSTETSPSFDTNVNGPMMGRPRGSCGTQVGHLSVSSGANVGG